MKFYYKYDKDLTDKEDRTSLYNILENLYCLLLVR